LDAFASMSLTLLSLLRGAGRAVPSVSQGLGGAAGGIIAPRFALATRNACSPPSSSSGEDGEDSQVGQPIPINYKKGGTDPTILADGEYPEWLWSMLDPKPTLSELERKLKPMLAEEIDGIGDLRSLMDASEEDIRRYAKLLGRAKIKENNAKKSK